MSGTNLRFPAEWEPQSAILLAWPHAQTDWAERLDSVEATYSALIAAITRFQPVLLCVADEALRKHAIDRLAGSGTQMDRVRFAIVEYDDTWLRDTGPITLRGDDGFVLLDFRFNAWGEKFTAERDDHLVESLFAQQAFRATRRERIEFTLEGGSVETDGRGTLLSTWQCLHKRHPGVGRQQLSEKLCEYLRQDRVLWLDFGYLQGDDTDAHIDTLARFASPTSIVYQGCDDQEDTHFEELRAMAVELAGMRTVDDRPYTLFALPWPRPIHDHDRRLAASYANFLIVNGAVLMPAYDDPADAHAAAVLAKAFPDREIVPIPCRPLIWQNGSLHCLTMQLPEGVL
jgi:agmatine/peptidylarginine deiminase